MLKKLLPYLIGACAGLVAAGVLPVIATSAQKTQISQATVLAQGSSDNSLRVLANCLDIAGYVSRSTPDQGRTSAPGPAASDGIVNTLGGECLNLRAEGQIQQVIDCMPLGGAVQVQFSEGKAITREWNNTEFVFVISYANGRKGWAERRSIDFNPDPAS